MNRWSKNWATVFPIFCHGRKTDIVRSRCSFKSERVRCSVPAKARLLFTSAFNERCRPILCKALEKKNIWESQIVKVRNDNRFSFSTLLHVVEPESRTETKSDTNRLRAEEVDRLCEAVEKHGRDWVSVAGMVGTKTKLQCRKKVQKEVNAGRMKQPEGN